MTLPDTCLHKASWSLGRGPHPLASFLQLQLALLVVPEEKAKEAKAGETCASRAGPLQASRAGSTAGSWHSRAVALAGLPAYR